MARNDRAYFKKKEKEIARKRKLARLKAELARIESGDYKKVTASKIIVFSVLVLSFVFDAVIIYGWFTGLEDAGALLIANEAVKGAAIGFYTWKAKNENCSRKSTNISDTQEDPEYDECCNEEEVL